MEMIKVDHVSYSYQTKYCTIEALKSVTCTFEEGKMYAIMGASGSGKSTLLSLLAGLDLPKSGDIYVEGESTRALNRDRYRRETAAVVYQSFNLFPLLTAQENVTFPMRLRGIKKKEADENAKRLIEKVGLSEKTRHQFPKMMSGGEQQRVAIARALASDGKIILADEPTGNLDSENEKNIVNLLKELAHLGNYTVIVITHNPEVAMEVDIIYRIKDGELLKEENYDYNK